MKRSLDYSELSERRENMEDNRVLRILRSGIRSDPPTVVFEGRPEQGQSFVERLVRRVVNR